MNSTSSNSHKLGSCTKVCQRNRDCVTTSDEDRAKSMRMQPLFLRMACRCSWRLAQDRANSKDQMRTLKRMAAPCSLLRDLQGRLDCPPCRSPKPHSINLCQSASAPVKGAQVKVRPMMRGYTFGICSLGVKAAGAARAACGCKRLRRRRRQ